MGQEHIRNLALIEGATVSAIADPDGQMRQAARDLCQREFGATPDIHHDFKDMLSAGNIDALLIASPNDSHYGITKSCLETGLPILCEKPVTTRSDQAFEIAELAERRDAPFWVAMEYRYMPPVARLIEMADAGQAGAIKRLSILEHRFPFLDKVGGWNQFSHRTGGTMVEKCCHFFDLMRFILKAEPIRLMASGGQDVNRLEANGDGSQPDMVDNAFVIVDFDNGTRASLDLCMFAEGSYFQETVTVIGDAAKIDAKVPGPARFWPGHAERNSYVEFSPRADKNPTREAVAIPEVVLRAGDHHGSSFFQHQRFFNVLQGQGQVEVTAHDGAMAVKMGEAAEQSIKTGAVCNF